MQNLDDLQALWQSQNPPAIDAFDPTSLRGAFRRFGRRQDIISGAKAALVLVALVRTATLLTVKPGTAIPLLIMLLTAALAVIAEWRIQRGIARLDFSSPSIEFVRDAITRMQAQRNPFHTREYAILFAALLIGYNATAFASWSRLTISERIGVHALATVSPLLLYFFGRWLRAKRWNAEYRPLIERLTVLLDMLEDQPS